MLIVVMERLSEKRLRGDLAQMRNHFSLSETECLNIFCTGGPSSSYRGRFRSRVDIDGVLFEGYNRKLENKQNIKVLWFVVKALVNLLPRKGERLILRQIAAGPAKALILAGVFAGFVGCSSIPYRTGPTPRTGTVRTSTLDRMERLNIDRTAPILIRIYKEESTLEIWKQDRTGQYTLLNSYPICKYSGHLGPKIFEGDHQAPEGFYDIAPSQMNPWSHEYLAFNIGFPNSFDRSLGRTGSFLMVHGGCESVGCYAITDYEMEEVYGLLDEAFKGGQADIQLEAFPFRMTMQNMMRHANDPNVPFWDMLKDGNDAFFLTGRPPRVAVCDHRYVFNPILADNNLDASAPCPAGIGLPVAAVQSPQSAASVAGPATSLTSPRSTFQAPLRDAGSAERWALTVRDALSRSKAIDSSSFPGRGPPN